MSSIADQGHYSHEDWVDFVRDVAPSTGSKRCSDTSRRAVNRAGEVHETWKAVLETVREEPSFEPPAEAMRLAKAALRRDEASASVSRIVRATAKLLFDSQLAAAAAGVRTLRPGPRKLLYLCENEKFLVDLQVEPSRDRAKTVLIGQVMGLDTRRAARSPECRCGCSSRKRLIAQDEDEPIRRISASSSTARATICLSSSISITPTWSSR